MREARCFRPQGAAKRGKRLGNAHLCHLGEFSHLRALSFIAATTVTQRQLLLAKPVKLPVLNIDLPLWGFFFLAPILFVIFHLYTLLQVLLLGRTTAVIMMQSSPINCRQKRNLAAAASRQYVVCTDFAGSPRERKGFIGWLMRAIVWITLAIAPILVVLAFLFSFLAYHSHIATWTHTTSYFGRIARVLSDLATRT